MSRRVKSVRWFEGERSVCINTVCAHPTENEVDAQSSTKELKPSDKNNTNYFPTYCGFIDTVSTLFVQWGVLGLRPGVEVTTSIVFESNYTSWKSHVKKHLRFRECKKLRERSSALPTCVGLQSSLL